MQKDRWEAVIKWWWYSPIKTFVQVPAAFMLRYLGFSFNINLNWTHHVEVMCNRSRVSIKSLKLLDNLAQGLDHASWCLAYNTIGLPILIYGCQLWYTGKQKGQVTKLPTVQNEAIRAIACALCTAPYEPFHWLLSILPMNLRLMMLTQNTALWLYRVSTESQLLRRLGGDWHTPQPQDFPLPTPNSDRAHTTLHMLAARVSLRGPCMDHFPNLPPSGPLWDGRVKWILKQVDWDYYQTTIIITNLCTKGRSINIFCDGTLSNGNHKDGKQMDAASAVL